MSDAGTCERHYSQGDEAIGGWSKGRFSRYETMGELEAPQGKSHPANPHFSSTATIMMHFSRLSRTCEWALPGSMLKSA